MMQVSSIACPQTGTQCQRSVCLQGLKCVLGNPAETVVVQAGWRCPRCNTINAPWAPKCMNTLCGVNLTVSAVATNQRGGD